MNYYSTITDVILKAQLLLGKSLREILNHEEIIFIENEEKKNGTNRKGFLGEIVEKNFFKINPGSSKGPDFPNLKLELKVTPLKLTKNGFTSKERLVFSMIDYCEIVNECWENSSFLNKNKNLLIIFYLYEEGMSILDYKFYFLYLIDLEKDFNSHDLNTIKKDWHKIKETVINGKAHLLSEKHTQILAACTKASNNKDRRKQPFNLIEAKPRAYSLKNSYLSKIVRMESTKNKGTKFIGITKIKK